MKVYKSGQSDSGEYAAALADTLREELSLLFPAYPGTRLNQAEESSAEVLPRERLAYVMEKKLRDHLAKDLVFGAGIFFCMGHARTIPGGPTIDHSFEHKHIKKNLAELLVFLNNSENKNLKDAFLLQSEMALFFKQEAGGLVELSRGINLAAFSATENLWYLCGLCNTGRNKVPEIIEWFSGLVGFGPSFVKEADLENKLHHGIIIDRLSDEDPSGMHIQIGDNLIELRPKNSVGVGKYATEWFKSSRQDHLAISKEFSAGIEALVYGELFPILGLLGEDSPNMSKISMCYRRLMAVLTDTKEILMAILKEDKQLSDSQEDNSDTNEIAGITRRRKIEFSIVARKQEWFSKIIINILRSNLPKAQSKEICSKITVMLQDIPFPGLLPLKKWDELLSKIKEALLASHEAEHKDDETFLFQSFDREVSLLVFAYSSGVSPVSSIDKRQSKAVKRVRKLKAKIALEDDSSSIDDAQEKDDTKKATSFSPDTSPESTSGEVADTDANAGLAKKVSKARGKFGVTAQRAERSEVLNLAEDFERASDAKSGVKGAEPPKTT